jgi:hypothetical protein
MFFELRQYRMHPGQRDNWVRFMEDVIIPFQTEKGMTIVGSFVSQDEDDLDVWIRRFESEAERERLYQEVYQSDHWKTEIAPKIPEMMDRDRMKVTRVEPTGASTMR